MSARLNNNCRADFGTSYCALCDDRVSSKKGNRKNDKYKVITAISNSRADVTCFFHGKCIKAWIKTHGTMKECPRCHHSISEVASYQLTKYNKYKKVEVSPLGLKVIENDYYDDDENFPDGRTLLLLSMVFMVSIACLGLFIKSKESPQ